MFPASDDQNSPRAFTFIYGDGYEFHIPTYEYPKKIEAIDIDHDGRKELFLYAYGGTRYTKFFVFKYEGEKGLHKLLENGSALGIELSMEDKTPMIKVGRAMGADEGWTLPNSEPRWEVYGWNGNDFQYQAEASTAPQTPEPQEYQGLVGAYTAVHGQNISSGAVVRAKKGDTLVYHKETVTLDDYGPEQMINPDTGRTVRVSREAHQAFKVIKKEDFGEAYGFYLKPGLSWEEGKNGFTQRCSRNSGTRCYYVQKVEDVSVPAGVFKGCFRIVADNIADVDASWYYPGIGVVRSEYRRHGTVLNVVSELEQIIRK